MDATQAIGRITAEVSAVDFLVASGYKWLCGIHGLGVIYARPDFLAELHPGSLGWYSAKDMFAPDRFESYTLKPGASRLQLGMPNFPALYALNASVNCLNQVGVERRGKSLLPLMRKLYDGLIEPRLNLLTPPVETVWSGMISFSSAQADISGRSLEERSVVVWCGDGRVRASVHLYNNADDIEVFLETLRNALKAHNS